MMLLLLCLFVYNAHCMAAADLVHYRHNEEVRHGAVSLRLSALYPFQEKIIRCKQLLEKDWQSRPGNHIFEVDGKTLTLWYPLSLKPGARMSRYEPTLPNADLAYVVKAGGCTFTGHFREDKSFVRVSMTDGRITNYEMRTYHEAVEYTDLDAHSDLEYECTDLTISVNFAGFKKLYDEFNIRYSNDIIAPMSVGL